MNKVLNHIPGFRSHKIWKMAIAFFWYLPSLSLISESLIASLIMISIPFILFGIIKTFKNNQNIEVQATIQKSNSELDMIKNDLKAKFENPEINTEKYKIVNLLTKKWSEACYNQFVSLDIETTGLSPYNDKILEISAVKYNKFEEVEKFSTLINPGISIPRKITKINGITNQMVKDSPTIYIAIRQFYDFVGDSIIVAHNATFDMNFLDCNARQNGLYLNNNVVDTLQACRKLFDFENNKLGTVCKNLKIKMYQYHRAESDARACAEVLIKCIYQFKKAS